MSIASDHAHTAAHFSDLVAGTTDWDAPTPVPEWVARDVVHHLVTWLPGFLGGAGVDLAPGPDAATEPAAAWAHQVEQVQRLLDDPATEQIVYRSEHMVDRPLPEVISDFYIADIFMHSWDLARATGQDDTLDAARCQAMYDGMLPMSHMLQASGQFGTPVPVPDDAPAQDKLMGLIGRDPQWRPPGS